MTHNQFRKLVEQVRSVGRMSPLYRSLITRLGICESELDIYLQIGDVPALWEADRAPAPSRAEIKQR